MRARIPLHWLMLIALALALATGLGLQQLTATRPGMAAPVLETLRVVAQLFLLLLKMVVLPLVVASLISGMAGLGKSGKFGRVGWKTAAYYFGSTTLAVTTGLALVNLIRPGAGAQLPLPAEGVNITAPERLTDLLLRIVPENVFAAMAAFDMLGVIFFALLFGLALNFVSPTARDRFLPLVDAILEVMLLITQHIIRLAPLGVFALVARLVAETGFDALRPLLPYALTVALGLAIHFFVTLPAILFLLTRRSPYKIMRATAEALLTAFSTASSSATLPLTMQRLEHGVGVSNRVASFVLPLGATINMDGTALYECIAVIFIAQALGVELALMQQVTVFVGAVLISIGAAGIPHAGLVMMTIILGAVGLPLEAAAMIWAVDRILDMCRTATNVWSDMTGAIVIAASEGELEPPRETGPTHA